MPHGIVFPDPQDVAVESGGAMSLRLPTLVERKLASGITLPQRLQDLADVIALIRANALPLAFGDQLHPFVREKWTQLRRDAQRVDPQAEQVASSRRRNAGGAQRRAILQRNLSTASTGRWSDAAFSSTTRACCTSHRPCGAA